MTRLLIIEDDIIDQMAIRRLLTKQPRKFDYQMADSLNNALSLLNEEPFDLVISDYNLSDGSAVELLDQKLTIPVIVITGMSDRETKEKLIKKGAFQVMVKDSQLRYIRTLPDLIQSALEDNTQDRSSDPQTIVQKPGPSGEVAVGKLTIDHLIDTFDGNIDFVKGMIQTFLSQNPLSIDKLNQAVAKEDFNQISMIAHKIKSGYRLMGAKSQVQLAEQIETDAQYGPDKYQDIQYTLSKLIANNKSVEQFLYQQLDALN